MFAYFAQTFCQDSSLWFFEQHPAKTGQALEAGEVKAFARETRSKSTRKARKETFFAQMSLLQNGQFASDSGF